MSRMRCLLIAALQLLFLDPAPAGSVPIATAIDSLLSLPALDTVDSEAGLKLTPHAISVDPMGRPWILDRVRDRVLRLGEPTTAGASISVAETRTRDSFPFADIAASGTYLFLLDPASPSLTLLDLDGYARERVDLADEVLRAGEQGLSASRLLVGRSGDLWLIDLRGKILHFDRRGRFLDAPLDGLAGSERPVRIADAALSRGDRVVLLDPARSSLVWIPSAGEHPSSLILGGPLVEPVALAVDEDDTCFVLEGSGRIRAITTGGAVLFDGSPESGKPAPLGRACVTPAGILMRADPSGGRIARWKILRPTIEDEER